MKETYEKIKLEIIEFAAEDVITTSQQDGPELDEDETPFIPN